jgi:hypothetical protein
MYNIKNYGLIVWFLILLILVMACNKPLDSISVPNKETEKHKQEQTDDVTPNEKQLHVDLPVEGHPPTVLEAASSVIITLRNGDMTTLTSWVHPYKGVRFSPYSYVNTNTDLAFKKDELQSLMEDSTKHVWGNFAGSGEPIDMTYANYHQQFIYDVDFITDADIAINEVLGKGNTVNNIYEAYPKESHDFVEYHIKGIEPTFEGMDWRSLRLVFEKLGDDFALVGIIHDQWTP